MEKVNLFISYCHEDRDCLDRLKLYINEKECPHINIWYDEAIPLGNPWDAEIRKKLNDSQIVLLVISQGFLNSVYINNVELITALGKQEQGYCRVIPVFAKTCDLDSHPGLLAIQGFPRDQSRPFDKMKETEKSAQYTLLRNELNQLVKDTLREKISLKLSQLKRQKIFLSIPQSDQEKEKRNKFVSEAEQKRKYEKWEYQIVPTADEIDSFYTMTADKQTALISKFQKDALYSIHLVGSESCLEEGIGKLQYDLTIKNTSNDTLYRKIIWILDGATTGKIDKGPGMNPRVCGNDSQKIFEIIHNLDEEKAKSIIELEAFLTRRKNVFMFYDFKKDHDNKTRIELKTMIEEYKNDAYQNVDLRLESSWPKASLREEEKSLAGSQGGFIFYGNADATWFVSRQAMLLDTRAKQAKCIYIDEPEIEVKVKRDLNKKPFTMELFTIIKGNVELQSGVKDFLDYLLRENS
jgi:hypothetical protein